MTLHGRSAGSNRKWVYSLVSLACCFAGCTRVWPVIVTLAVENYRSLRDLVMPLTGLTVVTGANGSGKSSLYRALRLLSEAARNGAVAALAHEGGLESTLWAGPATIRRGRGSKHADTRAGQDSGGLRLGFGSTDFGYAIDLGIHGADYYGSLFQRDPEIKREVVFSGAVLREATTLVDRHNQMVTIRDDQGKRSAKPNFVRPFDSVLSELADPQLAPELFAVRERLRSWRFYDHFRTDAHAPARNSWVGTRTPVLAADGGDVAAALQTIREIGDDAAMDQAIDNALPGSRIEVVDSGGRFELQLQQPGLLRPLAAAELSDGTLRYLLLVAALLTARPPELMVLNEPETSLHPELLAPLGSLIALASQRSQVMVVSHSRELIAAIDAGASELSLDTTVVELVKDAGETLIDGQALLERPAWHWPKR